ncbi:MAG: PDZ domain-containing protein [Planctomycetes bacterium]|nr:PDZ domain-containing protein [Planctomycetota bacterium]
MNQAFNSCITGLNSLGQGFWDYAADIFIQASVLIILLLIIDFLLRKRIRAVFRYCLWMLVFIKLILPASFSLPTGIGSWMGDYFPNEVSMAKWIPQTEEIVPTNLNIHQRSNLLQPVVTNETAVSNIFQGYIPLEIPMMNETAAAGTELEAISWQGLLFSGWLIGMLVLLALLVKRIYFVRGMIAQSKPANERLQKMLDECRCRIGIRQNIELRLSGNMHSPAVCGLFKPIILTPAVLLKKLSQKKLKTVLIHELAHIKRDDIWVNLLQTILQIVHFYNPFLWIANAMVNRAREQAVDEMVLVTLNPETKNYSNMLIDIAEMAFWKPKFGVRLIGVVESKKALERRINHMLNRPVPKSSKLGNLGLIAIVIIGAVILPMGHNPAEQTALAASVSDERIADNKIVPGMRVGEYTFDMTEDDVLERLGKPRVIFYGDEKYTLDNLPRRYFMVFDDVSFGIHNDSVKGITVISPYYKFANGLGVGDSEQKIKQAFGDDFHIREFKRKDFLSYEDKGLMFEIDKRDRTVMEINVSPIERSKFHKKADIVSKIIVPGLRVGDYTFDMSKDDVLEIFGKPGYIFYGDNKYSLDNLPENYYMPYEDISFRIHNGSVKEITVLSPSYKLPNGLRVGDSEQKVKKFFGDDFHIKESKRKDFLNYEDEGLMFEIDKRDRTIMEINVSPGPASGHYKKADIPPTTYINEKGRLVDKVDYPFVNDPKVIGGWKSVDFVREINQFNPNKKNWKGALHLNHMIFEEGGTMTRSGQTWTKGLVLSDDTASKYIIKEIDGSAYMFYEWKSGDYTIRYMKPFYYVLKKVLAESLKYEPKYGKKANIPPTSTINEQGRIVDKMDWPFVNDPQLIGTWKSVDFVGEIEEFKADKKNWDHGELYLKGLIFKPNGKTFKPWWTWTKGLVFHSGDKTASKYTLKNIEGSTYMFYEWKSGDYTIRHSKPSYYVLKKVSSKTSGPLDKVWISKQKDDEDEIMGDNKSHIPPTSTINEQGHIVDKIDWPFVNDSQVLGTWKSVDFVGEIKRFKVNEQQWKGRGGELFLNDMIFGKNGRLICTNDKVPNGYSRTWTKGLVISDNTTKKASKYTIKEIDGSAYMFFEWKSGDYTFRHRKPSYYVLKKVSSETSGLAKALSSLARAWSSQPRDTEFSKQLPGKIEQLDIDTADFGRVIEIFGKPLKYVWGKKTFTEDDLPIRYIMVYPSQFRVFMSDNKIVEIRHESGFNYVFRGKLRHGSTFDEVFELIGHPEKIIQGEENKFKDGVLYKDIDGRKGHCYYARSDQNVRLWFLDYKIIAIYMTSSDYGASPALRKGLLGLELNNERWPHVNIVPGMPAAKAGLQNDDKILKVNGKDITHITTISGALEVLKGKPGEQVILTIQRGGQILTFLVERSK